MLHRWNPLTELNRMQKELSRNTASDSDFRASAWAPPVDIEESPTELVVRAELPGVAKQDVSITVENGVLTLSGHRKFAHEERKEQFVRVERVYGDFVRSFMLPRTVDAEKITATMLDGVLTVTLPRRSDAQPRKISVA